MVDELTTNPNRSDRIVREDGLPSRQTIDWFDDIEIKINEIINELNRLDIFVIENIPPDDTPELPSASENQTLQIYVTDDVGGPTPAYSDGSVWRRYKDGAVLSLT